MVDFDDLQASWDETGGVDNELLDAVADQVVQNHDKLASILDHRDRGEIVTAAVMVLAFSFSAWCFDNYYVRLGSLIVVAACFEISAVLLWGRRGSKLGPDQFSVRDFTLHQRNLVRRQIGLLRHVAWWYLLPIYVGLMVMMYGFGDRNIAIIFGVVVLVMYWRIWKMNQEAIADQLQPLDDAYTLTLESLDQPDEDFLNRSYQALTKPRDRKSKSTLYQVLALVCLLVLLFPVFSLIRDARHSYEKLSPFSAVRWQDDLPEVQVDEKWYELVKIDDISATEIVKFCEYRFLGLSRKRFEEDLVQVLTLMGHPPNGTSTLTVKELSTDETLVLDNVEWTSENRWAIKRSKDRPSEAQHSTRKISRNDARFVQAAREFMSAARRDAGFSGAVIIAQGREDQGREDQGREDQGREDQGREDLGREDQGREDQGNEVLFSKALGHSDLKSQQPNSLDTPFRIASLSKQFTAAAILHLQQEGQLKVSDPVAQYLPQFATSPYDTIQIHHLLSHTSGLPRTPTGEGRELWRSLSRRAATTSDYVDLATRMPLLSTPGSKYEYSNFGYRLLSAVIESVSDHSYADHMEITIFRPHGMHNSGVARFPSPDSESLVAHGLELEQLGSSAVPHKYRDGQHGRVYASGFGSGGIYASANDLLRWHHVLNGTELLSEDSKELLFRPNLDHYAYGWIVKKSGLDGKLYQMHSGANEGFFSQMMRVPEDDLVIIAVGNQDDNEQLDDIVDQFFRLARGLNYKLP